MAHGDFLRWEDGRNIYELDCPRCKTVGEVGVPDRSTTMFRHDSCGAMFIQKLTTGRNLFDKPQLITVAPALE